MNLMCSTMFTVYFLVNIENSNSFDRLWIESKRINPTITLNILSIKLRIVHVCMICEANFNDYTDLSHKLPRTEQLIICSDHSNNKSKKTVAYLLKCGIGKQFRTCNIHGIKRAVYTTFIDKLNPTRKIERKKNTYG